MGDRRGFILLFLIMTGTAVAIGAIAIGTLYAAQMQASRQLVTEVARLQAHLLQSDVEALDAGAPPRPVDEVARMYRLLGRSCTVAIGRIDGQTLIFLENPWLPDLRPPRPMDVGGSAAAPMRRALAGEEGLMVARNDRGQTVLAAFAPVVGRGLGVVASTELSAVRQPLAEPAAIVGLISLTLIVASTVLFFAVGNPMLRRFREGEDRFRELFENMRSGATVYRAVGEADDFVITGFNRGAERIEGIVRQDVLGRLVSEMFPALRRSPLFEMMRRVWRTGQSENVPATFYEDHRMHGWRESYIYRLSSGEIVALYDDVSERKRSEAALMESEARWRSIIEMHAHAIVIVDQQHEIRFVNKAAEDLFGDPAEALIGAPFGFPLVQGDVAGIEVIRPGRSLAFGEMRTIPMRWGGQDNYLLFIQDVSAQKRAETDLRKLFQAIEQSPASVMITDIDGRIEYVNPKFTETTGYTYSEVAGKTPSFLRSGHTSGREYDDLWKTISAGDVWRGEFNNRRKNGELFWELASIAPVRDGNAKVTHYVAVKEDISERKATEERLRRSQRMEMIGQLTGGIAHDFNNLLAIIIGNMQLLEEKSDLDGESRELIADAVWSAERGAQLTHRLLAFARRQRLNPKVTDLNDIVGEMADLLRRTLGEGIEVREELGTGLWETMIDRGQLESALLNLVVNARDAMPNGGVLTIATGTATLPGDLETPGEDVVAGDYVVLSVADTGTGMPPRIVERIFEPFFTTKKFGEGSGLGLSMVYGFVRQSGGHIVVESKVGSGTVVKLYMPRAAASAAGEASQKGRTDAHQPGDEVILVVEGDSRMRKTAISILRKHGYKVVEARNAGEAMQAVERMPRIDLLFTDVVLANGINGSELAHQVICRRPETKVLLTSGYAQQIPVIDELLGDGIDLLRKPYRRVELTTRVRELLDRQAG